jgi:hypothetical protein
MNTLNGNFIERVIPNIKNATLNLLIGDQLATMNLADFQAAIAPSYTSSKGLKMKDNLPLDGTLNNVVDSSDVVTISPLQLSTEAVGLSRTVNLSAGATTPRLFNVAYTINNSGAQTGTLTGLFLNATETSLNGITHNLMDLQVGGVSRAKITNAGLLTLVNSLVVGSSSAHYIQLGVGFVQRSATDGIVTFLNGAETGFTRINLGGTTSSFPAIARNSAAIEFLLADNSAYCNLRAAQITGTIIANNVGNYFMDSFGFVKSVSSNARFNVFAGGYSIEFGASTAINASAIFQLNSTTQGFLPPRMTTAQINAIATPANGLQVYNTDLAQPCFYDGAGWKKVSHTNM